MNSLGLRAAIAALVLAASAPLAKGHTCEAPAIGEEEVKKIIDKERTTRTDLPRAFPKSKWVVRREGCHYTAIESLVPETPEANHIFRLNQRGVIVDVTIGNSHKSALKCPDKVLSEAELARIVADARAARKDLPPAFPQSKARVDRARCTYLYFEHRAPEARGDYQVFIIDPLGELMEFQRSQPY